MWDRPVAAVITLLAVAVQCRGEDGAEGEGTAARGMQGTPYEDWAFHCERNQAIGGWRLFTSIDFENGVDFKAFPFCRALNQRTGPRVKLVRTDGCYEQAEFTLGQQFGFKNYEYNCEYGDFIQSIDSSWDPEFHLRKMKFTCCKPLNARINKRIGCNSVGPADIFKRRHSFIKNPYEPRGGCPNDVLVGVEYSKTGLAFKYCPLRVINGEYNTQICRSIKTTGVTNSELAQSTEEVLETMSTLGQDKESEPGGNWRLDCGGYSAVKSLTVKLVRLDSGFRDVVVKHSCVEQLDGQSQEAARIRISRFNKMTEFDVRAGCRKDEVLQGIMSKYEDGVRLVSLLCSQNSNAKVVETKTVVVTVESEEQQIPSEEIDGFVFHSLHFKLINVADSSVELTAVLSSYEFVDAKFQTSNLTDENTGETKEVEVEAGKSTSEGIAPDTTLTKGLDPESLTPIGEGEWTAAWEGFKFDCGAYRTLSVTGVKLVADGDRTDTSWFFKCKDVIQQFQVATIIRITQWFKDINIKPEYGCKGHEVLQGMQGGYRDGKRFLSFICAEGSNANMVDKRTMDGFASQQETLFEVETEEGVVGKESTGNIVSEETQNQIAMTVAFHKMVYVQSAKFTESLLIDEINNVTEKINPVKGKDPGGSCVKGVKSRWFGSKDCPDGCEDVCKGWEEGTSFGKFKSAACLPRGGADKCQCQFEHPQKTCLFDEIPEEGCVCLCNRVCLTRDSLPATDGPSTTEAPTCGAGVAYKYLPSELACTTSQDCLTSCQGWQPGAKFGNLTTVLCKADSAENVEVPKHKCYCEYEDACEAQFPTDDPASPSGVCKDGELSKKFGFNHCDESAAEGPERQCEQKCNGWVTGFTFGQTAATACKRSDGDESGRNECHCTYASESGSCEPAQTTTAPPGESIKGSFGEVRVIDKRQAGTLSVIAKPPSDGDGPDGVLKWLVVPNRRLGVCPPRLCNCDRVCDDWETALRKEGADVEDLNGDGDGERIEGTFGFIVVPPTVR